MLPFEAGGEESSAAAAARFAANIAAKPPPLPIPGITETGAELESAMRELAATEGAAGGARRAGGGAGAGAGLGFGGTSWRY